MSIPQISLDDSIQDSFAAEADAEASCETSFQDEETQDRTQSSLDSEDTAPANEESNIIAILDPRRSNQLTSAYLQPNGKYRITGYPDQLFSKQSLEAQFTRSFLVMARQADGNGNDLIEVYPQLNGRYKVAGEAKEMTEAALRAKYLTPDEHPQTIPLFPDSAASSTASSLIEEPHAAAAPNVPMRPAALTIPYNEGIVTRIVSGLFGGGYNALKAAATLLTAPVTDISADGVIPRNSEASATFAQPLQQTITALRLQEAREHRAMDLIITLEEQLEICKDQFSSLQDNPLLNEAIARSNQGDDPRDFALEMAHQKTPEHVKLTEKIQDFQDAAQELAQQIRKVNNACEKTEATDPSELLRDANAFLNEVQQSQEASVMPCSEDGTAMANKLKDLVESIQSFMRNIFRHSPENTEMEAEAPSL